MIPLLSRFSIRIIIGVLILVLYRAAPAQQPDNAARLRLAQSFEQSGDWERSAQLYESLLQAEPQNYVFFDGLRRCYIQLKQYEKAVILLQQRLLLQPNDPNLLSMLGGIYFLGGKEQRADSVWKLIINTDPKNQNLYRLVASQFMEHRLYEKAVESYLSARKATGIQDLFLDEVAMLYGVLQQYEGLTREYLMMLQFKPEQLLYVQARLASYTVREEARRAALRVVGEEIGKTPEKAPLRMLLAWLAMEGKDFSTALQEYRIVDRINKSSGTELFNFAQRALQERAYRSAAIAYREILEQYPSHQMTPWIRFGFARAIEELSNETDSSTALTGFTIPALTPAQPFNREKPVSESQPTHGGAIELYEGIIHEYPNSDVMLQSFFRLGTIRVNRFFDLDGAASAFGQIVQRSTNLIITTEARLALAEVHLMRGDLRQSYYQYLSVQQYNLEQYTDRISFRLSELLYFEAKFDSAAARLRQISTNVNTDLANDALKLLYFIEENKMPTVAALTQFARADLLLRQRKYSEALSLFETIIKEHKTARLIDDATLKIGEIQLLLHRTDEATATFRHMAEEMNTSIFRDLAQLHIGEIYERILRDTPKAITAYEALLTQFPKSLYVEETRKRIRLLRGDRQQ
ncbi:MAG: tetratricopeptide repeat protein [bacterium]